MKPGTTPNAREAFDRSFVNTAGRRGLGRIRRAFLGIAATLAAFAGLTAAASPASAARKVAIVEVTGPISEDITDALQRTLQDVPGVELIGRSRWQAAAGAAGLDHLQDRAKIAKRLRARRLIRADVRRKDRRWVLVVIVENSRGKRIKKWSAKAKKVRRLDFLIREQLVQALGPTLADTSGKAAQPEAAPPPPPARVQSGEAIRIGVLGVKGGKRSRRRLFKAIKADPRFKKVPDRLVKETAASLGVRLGTVKGRVAVARALRLQAWLLVRSRGRRQRYAATGRVYSGHDGRLVDKVEGRGKSEREALAGVVALLAGPVSRSRLPAPDATTAPEPTPPIATAPAAPPSASPEPTEPARGNSVSAQVEPARGAYDLNLTPLRIGVGLSLQRRDFDYTDAVAAGEGVRPYELPGGPALSLDARWYPGAHFTRGLFAHLGLEARGRFLLGVSSEDTEGNKFSTDSFDGFGGLRARIPIQSHEAGVALGAGHHTFSVDVPDDGPPLPTVSYTYLRVGADGRFSLPADLQAYAGVAWRQVFSAGEIGDDSWFPNATQGGIDALLALGWRPLSSIELRLGAEYTRYFFSLNPEVGDARVAGGALDQYIAGTFDVVWTLSI